MFNLRNFKFNFIIFNMCVFKLRNKDSDYDKFRISLKKFKRSIERDKREDSI